MWGFKSYRGCPAHLDYMMGALLDRPIFGSASSRACVLGGTQFPKMHPKSILSLIILVKGVKEKKTVKYAFNKYCAGLKQLKGIWFRYYSK